MGLLTRSNSNSKKNSNFTNIARISKEYSCGCFYSPKSDILKQMFTFKRLCEKNVLVVQSLKLRAPSVGGLGLILGQGTRSHMPQLRV